MRCRLETTPSTVRGEQRVNTEEYESGWMSVFGFTPSSSAATAKRGMMSRLWVLFITSGLALRSDWEELEEARGRRLKKQQQFLRDFSSSKESCICLPLTSPCVLRPSVLHWTNVCIRLQGTGFPCFPSAPPSPHCGCAPMMTSSGWKEWRWRGALCCCTPGAPKKKNIFDHYLPSRLREVVRLF